MKILLLIMFFPFSFSANYQVENKEKNAELCLNTLQNRNSKSEKASGDTSYLASVISELKKKWPENEVVNLVFHGHSVPAGYFQTPSINTFQSYPFLVLKKITDSFPTAEVNCIRTAIGGENSEQGAKRFDSTVLNHQPNVLFIDYALNDRNIGLKRSLIAWEYMIQKALMKNIKVVLLTPTPDMNEDIVSSDAELGNYANQIIVLAKKYNIGLIDSYNLFKKLVENRKSLKEYMAQSNHPNQLGHQLVANEICKLFGLK